MDWLVRNIVCMDIKSGSWSSCWPIGKSLAKRQHIKNAVYNVDQYPVINSAAVQRD